MRKLILIVFPVLLWAGTYDYLKIPVSSKESSIFKPHGLFGESPSALFVNPASIFEASRSLDAGYGNYIIDMHQGYISYPFYRREKPFIGVGIHFLHLGKFTKTDTFGNIKGEYSGQNIALDLYFPVIKKYKIAGAFELYYNLLDEYNSLATAISLGWNFFEKVAFKDGLWRNSLIIKHIGFEIKSFDKERAELPLTILWISGIRFNTFQAGISLYYTLNSGFDAEISYLYRWGRYLKVAFGYTTAYRDVNVEENIRHLFSGFALGMGIDIKRISLFYSYTPFGVFGDIHRIDISYKF